MKEQKELSDLGFIAGLVTKGYQPLEAYKQGTRVVFVFEWDDNMRSLETDYFNNSLEVDARTYQGNLRDIKKQYLYRGER
jgi:hypothetical protein